jgi:hypothetical protein
VRVGAPVELNRVIARRAVQYAREDMRGRGWTSTGALQPYSDTGAVGISSTMKHLLIQNKGFDPFVMWWVEGRMVPITDKQTGKTRRVRGREPGKPGYVYIPGRGKIWRDQKWRHPGLKPKRFMEAAIAKAIKESKRDIRDAAMTILSGGRL